jgi:hypothetical protein
MDTMTASGTGLLQFSRHDAGLERAGPHMRTLFSQFESLSCKKLGAGSAWSKGARTTISCHPRTLLTRG